MPKVSISREETKNIIMEGCIRVFNDKGLKFTMDDVAARCHISKKTLYLVFNDKEELFFAMVNYVFDGIKESERKVMTDDSLSTLEKIRKILGVLPESYTEIDFSQLFSLKEKYPKIYKKVEERLETGWETTISLIEKGQKEGVIKPIHIPIVKMMLEASLEQFFQRDVLVKNRISYKTALNEVVNILVDGIIVK